MCALEQIMGEKENQIDEDIRKAFGWQITHEKFEQDLRLSWEASYMAAVFAATATCCPDDSFQKKWQDAEEKLQLLKDQSLSPFPLPFRVFELNHVYPIINAECRLWEAEDSFRYTLGPQHFWSNEEEYRKPIVAEFYERFRKATQKFFGQEGAFLEQDTSQKIRSLKKKEIERILSETFDWRVTEEELERNLELSFPAICWAGSLGLAARIQGREDYQHCLDNANKYLSLLRKRANPFPPLPEGGFTIRQARMTQFIICLASEAREDILCSLAQKSLPEDKDENRKRTLQPFYEGFKTIMRELLNHKQDVPHKHDIFHGKSPFEVLMDRHDKWIYPTENKEIEKLLQIRTKQVRDQQIRRARASACDASRK